MSSLDPKKRLVIFLDFDGVLHPYGCANTDLLCRRLFFESILREFAEIEVVISSAWRKDDEFSDLVQNFSVDLRHRFIGITGIDSSNALGKRHRECVQWLKDNGREGERWMAIEDDTDNFGTPRNGGSVVFVDPSTGLDEAAMRILRQAILISGKPIVFAYEKW